MFDEIIENVMDSAVSSLECDAMDDVVSRMREELSEIEPDPTLSNEDIFKLINLESIVTDECQSYQNGVSDDINDTIDSEACYTEDCMDIISEVGISDALEAYLDLSGGSINIGNIPDAHDIAVAVLYQNINIDFNDVVAAFFERLEDDCNIEDVCDQFRAGELKEDALTEGEEHEE